MPKSRGEDIQAVSPEDLPKHWPEHLDEAIRILNWRLLPALKFSPKELFLGLVINTKPSFVNTLDTNSPVTEPDVALQMAYVAQQRLDGYNEAVAHAMKRKTAFDKKVLARSPGEVIFSNGDLVQIYRSDLDFTFKTDRKLLPKWSTPQRVTARHLNSYELETLSGDSLPGSFSSRRLRRFLPKDGSKLAEEQKLKEERAAGAVQEGQKGTGDTTTAERHLPPEPDEETNG
jgi:hypothetical protein